jgi:hypothetical protein
MPNGGVPEKRELNGTILLGVNMRPSVSCILSRRPRFHQPVPALHDSDHVPWTGSVDRSRAQSGGSEAPSRVYRASRTPEGEGASLFHTTLTS